MFYGESLCENTYLSGKKKGKRCTNYAYYVKEEKYLCGVHSKPPRTKLPVNPRKKEIEAKKLTNEKKIIEEVANNNLLKGLRGNLVCSKLRMMKKPEDIKGYLKVFPNFKHQNRKDGFGCSSLSPKALGPINHNMLNLPPAKNLENYHQFSKFFLFEVKDNIILNSSLERRIKGYNDPIPHRHKFNRDILHLC